MTQTVALTKLELIDCAPLKDEDRVTPGYYVAATGINMERRYWRASGVFRSLDRGHTFNEFITAIRHPAGIGAVLDVSGGIKIRMLNDVPILSATPEALVNGANLAIVGDSVIQFETATLVDVRTYMLSGIILGARGSEPVAPKMADRFVLVNEALVWKSINEEQLGKEYMYIAHSHGRLGFNVFTRFTCNATWWNNG